MDNLDDIDNALHVLRTTATQAAHLQRIIQWFLDRTALNNKYELEIIAPSPCNTIDQWIERMQHDKELLQHIENSLN